MKESEIVKQFMSHVTNVVSQLRFLGEYLSDQKMLRRF